ncbi:hypothetical protein GCM10009872_37740 [Actinopolymorpha rutila]
MNVQAEFGEGGMNVRAPTAHTRVSWPARVAQHNYAAHCGRHRGAFRAFPEGRPRLLDAKRCVVSHDRSIGTLATDAEHRRRTVRKCRARSHPARPPRRGVSSLTHGDIRLGIRPISLFAARARHCLAS